MKRNGIIVNARAWRAEKNARQGTSLSPAPNHGQGVVCLRWADKSGSAGSAHTYVRAEHGQQLLAALRKFIALGGNPWAVLQNSEKFMSAKDRAAWKQAGGERPVVGCLTPRQGRLTPLSEAIIS